MNSSFLEICSNPIFIGALALVFTLSLAIINWMKIPVSMPGGPRKKRETRVAKWEEKTTTLEPGWTCLTAEKAHNFTEQMFPSYPKLTGESAGRQVWYHQNLSGTVDSEDSETPVSAGEEGFIDKLKKIDLLEIIGVKPPPTPSKENTKNLNSLEFSAFRNPNSGDNIFRKQMISKWTGAFPNSDAPNNAKECCRKGIQFYQMLQCEDGHWAGDYGGPMFLMPGLIICHYVSETIITPAKKRAMTAYLKNHQQADGGWGLHIESASTMFGTVLNYVALRLMGEDADSNEAIKAREFILTNGGALYTASWGKFWLAILGVMEWDCINSVPPEMWLLPRWFPFHPGRLWCHCRMVYLPMCFIYGKRFTYPKAASDPLIKELHQELYVQDYNHIPWGSHRQTVSVLDEYDPVGKLMRFIQSILAVYEKYCPWKIGRAWALKFAFEYIEAEDRQTNYIDIGPVNKALNMLCVWVERGSDSEEFKRHLCRVDDYLWVAEDGMKMQGYNGSQCWDTSFAMQAIVESGMAEEFSEVCTKAYKYFASTQIKFNEDNKDYWFRHESLGGWPFSTAAHGWPISDCTSEGLKAVLALNTLKTLQDSGVSKLIPEQMLYSAVNVILSYQNKDGGWATYENNRGYRWYEYLNPSDVFGDIMIDYSYVECSAACITALSKFKKAFPEHRKNEIATSLKRARKFLKTIQRDDGSWYGSWGVCFTYATWFGIEGLVVSGEPKDSPCILKACEFLVKHQNENGGWGESYLSCVDKAYSEKVNIGNGGSGVVQTAWALLALMEAGYADVALITRGVKYLQKMQEENGDWLQEGMTGVFNRNCGITYTAYRNIFPIWALGRYAKLYETSFEGK